MYDLDMWSCNKTLAIKQWFLYNIFTPVHTIIPVMNPTATDKWKKGREDLLLWRADPKSRINVMLKYDSRIYRLWPLMWQGLENQSIFKVFN